MTEDTTFPSPDGEPNPTFEEDGQGQEPPGQDSPTPPDELAALAEPAPQRLIIKARAGAFGEYRDQLEEQLGDQLGGGWAQLKERFPELTINRAFRGLEGLSEDGTEGGMESEIEGDSEENEQSVLREAMTYYEVLLPPGREEALEVGNALSDFLNSVDAIEFTYFESPPAPQPSCDGTNRPYLSIAPRGMNVNPIQGGAAHKWPRVVDLERVWDRNSHPQLAHVGVLPGFEGPAPGSGYDNFVEEDFHATRSLCVLVASGTPSAQNPGTLECDGLLPPEAPVFLASSLDREQSRWVERINSKIELVTQPNNGMQPGDILLVELQICGRQRDSGAEVEAPIELEPANDTALRLARARGIIVIEPAGNGGVNLKDVNLWQGDRLGPISGTNAICVAACHAIASNAPIERLPESNFGAAVSCFCWGENVPTEVGIYDGTSAASALIAGAAARIQGATMTSLQQRLRVKQMRVALKRGTDKTEDLQIGVMPNLNP